MNDRCQDDGCQKRVDGHQVSLYGEDGMSGLVGEVATIKGCLKKFITRNWFFGALASAVAFLLLLLVPLWQRTSEKVAEVTNDVAVQKVLVDRVEKHADKIGIEVEKLAENLDTKLNKNRREIVEDIERVIRRPNGAGSP